MAALFADVQRRPAVIRVLDADPELGRVLPRTELDRATRAARARLVTLDPGSWRPRTGGDLPGALGLLVLDGLVCRAVPVGAECSCELLGQGDLLRPWADDASEAIPSTPEWEVLSPTRLAVLDRAFAQAIAPWPELSGELVGRALGRAHSQAVLVATSHVKRVDVRLLALFWQLAERWGRVTPEGIVVPIPLIHARLAALVGAQRPSVTTALKRLERRGVVIRTEAGWLVADSAADELEQLCFSSDARHLRLVHRVDEPLGAGASA